MKNFKKDLNDAATAAKALVLKVEKLQKQYADMVKKHPKMPTKKAPTKRTVAKKAVAKKVAPKNEEITASDTVLAIVNRSKKGVDSSTVMKKTGFVRRKVADAFFKLKKQGKIRNVRKGVYVKA